MVNDMAFVNEPISDRDKLRISDSISFERINAQTKFLPHFLAPLWWTIDRDKGVYLICLTTGGREQLGFYVLGIDGQTVVFNVEEVRKGDDLKGVELLCKICDLQIPSSLKSRQKEIEQFIRDGLNEKAFFRPLADGGSIAYPNTLARWNIISFNVDFK